MSEWNFVGDVHGNMKSLEKLAELMPKAPFFSLGDMIDRGKDSKRVIEFFMEEGNRAVLGNHEHFMLDFYFDRINYSEGIWFYPGNGGFLTILSYKPRILATIKKIIKEEHIPQYEQLEFIHKYLYDRKKSIIPSKVIKWIDSLPVYYEEEKLFVSHAPRFCEDLGNISKAKSHRSSECKDNLMWNIVDPPFIEGVTQIHGHVINSEPKIYTRNGIPYGYNIDTQKRNEGRLTGLHWPSMKLYSVVVE